MDPWQSKLEQGDAQAAWDLFAERYRNLILATIRRLIPDHDDLMDVFSNVCEALTANEFKRLRQYSAESARRASVSTWLVIVVRNLTVDWLRARDGRQRIVPPSGLTPLQQQIYAAVCIEARSHVEAYELIRGRTGSAMPFHEFLREVRATQHLAPCFGTTPTRPSERSLEPDDLPAPAFDAAESAEAVRQVRDALGSQPADVRLAVELFVVDQLSAEDVARAVGWPNAKAVYNRVRRALVAVRAALEGKGIGRGDL